MNTINSNNIASIISDNFIVISIPYIECITLYFINGCAQNFEKVVWDEHNETIQWKWNVRCSLTAVLRRGKEKVILILWRVSVC